MTKKPAIEKNELGRFIPNKAKAKAGLNKAILNVGWYQDRIVPEIQSGTIRKSSF